MVSYGSKLGHQTNHRFGHIQLNAPIRHIHICFDRRAFPSATAYAHTRFLLDGTADGPTSAPIMQLSHCFSFTPDQSCNPPSGQRQAMDSKATSMQQPDVTETQF